jgi:prepilin-type N-terminal cleavage/methylation domain-containing protein
MVHAMNGHSGKGFALPELMITVVILGILAGVVTVGMLASVRVWGLRNAAVELAGYLDNAQALAAASTDACVVEISGTGSDQQIGPAAAIDPNSCAGLAPARLLPTSPLPIILEVVGDTLFTIEAGGIVIRTFTAVLAVEGSDQQMCVQIFTPSALVSIGIFASQNCDHAASN